MTPKQFYYSKAKEVIADVCQKAGTSVANFQQIAIANGCVSPRLASKLAEASDNEMTELEILYPDRFENKTA